MAPFFSSVTPSAVLKVPDRLAVTLSLPFGVGTLVAIKQISLANEKLCSTVPV